VVLFHGNEVRDRRFVPVEGQERHVLGHFRVGHVRQDLGRIDLGQPGEGDAGCSSRCSFAGGAETSLEPHAAIAYPGANVHFKGSHPCA
jgi:hypothetical protein